MKPTIPLTVAKSPQITTVYDIRKAINEFAPTTQSNLTAQLKGVNGEGGEPVVFNVSAQLDCDYYTQFIQGLTIIKNRVELADKYGEVGRRALMIESRSWVDNIITQKLGGKREGYRVRWDIPEGTYYFDPFTRKLTRCESSSTLSSSAPQ